MTPNAIVFVIDRLGSGYLGPYGNTWLETPAWNRLASRGTLFETAIIDSPDLSHLYNAYWYGQHAATTSVEPTQPSLIDLLADGQIQSWLITDEPSVAQRAEATRFSRHIVLPTGTSESAASWEDTQLARLFATVLEVLEQAEPPFFIWVHAQAMQASWDAPYPLRAQFAEEDDPDPPEFTQPPEHHLEKDYDPDLLLGIQHAYGGQVALLDSCLGIVLDALWSHSIGMSTALLTTAARGFPLGEHRYVGQLEMPLYGELLQVPWINYWPDSQGAAWRVPHIVQPADLFTTMARWMNVDSSHQALWGQSLRHGDLAEPAKPADLFAYSAYHQQRSLRVPGWFLRCEATGSAELYVKPDDRWEFNEIASRCPAVVDDLLEVMRQIESAAQTGNRQRIPSLPEALLHGMP